MNQLLPSSGTALELNLDGRCTRRTPADGKIGIKLRIIMEIRMVLCGFAVYGIMDPILGVISFNNLLRSLLSSSSI